MLEGKRRMPRKGDVCDTSCQFSFCCANAVEGEICRGFQLLSNGKITRLVKQNLAEYDEEYIQSCVRMVQNGCSPETEELMVQEVYRYLKPQQQINPECGFRAMLDEATKRSFTPTPTPKPITRGSRDGFIGMLEEASRGSEPESIIIRNFGTVHHPEYGFKAMAAASFGETPTITRKPIHRVPLGFRAMLDDFNRGNEEEEVQSAFPRITKPKPIVRSLGFRGMLDDLSKAYEG